ncbi:Uncharacterised protein [Klebsiella pneumoniae]|nr:Uncharacterised protein [Klebsiella pneumoniae]
MINADKTKAALQGRQCHYQIHSQDSTAGDLVNRSYGITGVTKGGIPPLKQNHVVTHLPPYLAFGSCRGCSDMSNGQLQQSSPFLRSNFCLALSRFVASARMASSMNLEGVSPSILTSSTKFITSCGTRKVTERDFEFTGPVGIAVLPINLCKTLYTKKTLIKELRCKTPNANFVLHPPIGEATNSEARQCANTNRASYQTVNQGNSYG